MRTCPRCLLLLSHRIANHGLHIMAEPCLDCLLFGAAHVDRTGRLTNVAQLDRSNPGKFEQSCGGAAFNVGRILAALGADVCLNTILGTDSSADEITAEAQRCGVVLVAQRSTFHSTASYTSILQPDGQLVIALADMAIYDEMQSPECETPPSKLVCLDANLSENALSNLLNQCEGPVAGLTVSAAKAHRLSGVLDSLTYLFTNKAECDALFGLSEKVDWDTRRSAVTETGLKNVCISDGANGVHVFCDSGWHTLTVPKPHNLVDVTGAGDALAGAALFGLSRGQSFISSINMGIRAAQIVLQVKGPLPDAVDFARAGFAELAAEI